MFRKLNIFIDSALRSQMNEDAELCKSAGFAKCFLLVPNFTSASMSSPALLKCANDGVTPIEKLLHDGWNEHKDLVRAFNEANRINVTISRFYNVFRWELETYRKGETKPAFSAVVQVTFEGEVHLVSILTTS